MLVLAFRYLRVRIQIGSGKTVPMGLSNVVQPTAWIHGVLVFAGGIHPAFTGIAEQDSIALFSMVEGFVPWLQITANA